MVRRLLRLDVRNSTLLLGPRGTGKSTLIRRRVEELPRRLRSNVLWIDLLRPEDEDRYARHPGDLRDQIAAQAPELVVIDEVQKVPKLLDVAQEMIESRGTTFILSGSSARKLKRGSANLLAGRALSRRLEALTHIELGSDFDVQRALEFGMLPKVHFPYAAKPEIRWSNEERTEYLRTYARTYLKEEVQLEQLVRKIDPFRNFLEVAAQSNGKIIELANIARDVGVDGKTVAEYFQLLEDTLIGFFLEPFHRSLRKRQGSRPKFYLFDTGVKRALDRTLTVPLSPGTSAYGDAFEHFVILEIYKLVQMLNPDIRMSFFRTSDGLSEVDVIVERPGKPVALVEIKSATRVDDKVISKLKRFEADFAHPEMYVFSNESRARSVQGVNVVHWSQGIRRLFARELKSMRAGRAD